MFKLVRVNVELYRCQHFPDKLSCASTSPPHVSLYVFLMPSSFSSPSISLHAASHLSHWSHYQLLPNRKGASLLSWGSRCLPIVVVWSDSEIYSHRPGRRTCVCGYVCVQYVSVTWLIEADIHIQFSFVGLQNCYPFLSTDLLDVNWPLMALGNNSGTTPKLYCNQVFPFSSNNRYRWELRSLIS